MSKRLFDVAVSAILLTVTTPLLLMAALGILVQHGGPVLFRQTRIGRFGRPFKILKFRTMHGAPGGAQITIGRDPRITSFGHFLRQTKIDELPQLMNVLIGDMSLVGPRPEVPEYYDMLPEIAREAIASVRPGITDRASIFYRNEAELLAGQADPASYYRDIILPHKVELAIDYVHSRTMFGDIRLLLATVLAVVKPK